MCRRWVLGGGVREGGGEGDGSQDMGISIPHLSEHVVLWFAIMPIRGVLGAFWGMYWDRQEVVGMK